MRPSSYLMTRTWLRPSRGAILSKFRNAGQTCVCTNRLLVQETVYDEFVQLFQKAVAELTVGDGFDEGVSVGPLIDSAAAARRKGLY